MTSATAHLMTLSRRKTASILLGATVGLVVGTLVTYLTWRFAPLAPSVPGATYSPREVSLNNGLLLVIPFMGFWSAFLAYIWALLRDFRSLETGEDICERPFNFAFAIVGVLLAITAGFAYSIPESMRQLHGREADAMAAEGMMVGTMVISFCWSPITFLIGGCIRGRRSPAP
jgi:hypothetical protein